MELSPRAEQIEGRKARAIEALSVQFSHNALPLDEYERLVEYINRAESERELGIIERIVDETALYAGVAPERPAPEGDLPPVDLDKFSLTLLSSRTIPGELLRQGRCSFVTILGNNIIDIREGDLPPGRTQLDLVTILGETVVQVPPGLAVTVKSLPIAGNVNIGRGVETRRAPGEPELVLTGPVLLGNIDVKLRKDKKRFF
jgi:hypothetical protein